MGGRILASVLGLLFLGACTGAPDASGESFEPAPPVDAESAALAASTLPGGVREEILEAVAELERRMGANDLAGVAALYADDAVLLSPSGRTTAGREAIDAYWQGFGEGVAWDLSVLSLEGSRNLVAHRGVSTLTYVSRGEERTSTVDFWLTWRRGPQGWRVAVDAYW